jgi:hydroxylaminobenzene mutase
MSRSIGLARQGHRQLQVGAGLLLFSALEGLAIPYLAAPNLALSAHKLSALQGVLYLALGLVWTTHLNLGATASRIAFWFLIYSGLAILSAYLMGAIWGAGNETMPLAGGIAHGSASHEMLIKVLAYSSATGLISFWLIVWGLRIEAVRSR